MNVKEKNVLVFGSGISGIAASRMLLAEGARVILYDGNTSLDPEKVKADILKESFGSSGAWEADRVQVILGELPEEVMDTLALMVISPGVPTDLPVVEKMRQKHSTRRY